MTRIYIVRHGNTFAPNETPRRIGAHTDIALVDSGVAQADRIGRAFADMGLRFDAALVSPLRRTRETAACILYHLEDAPSVEPTPWLAEIDHGPDENRTDADIIARIGEAALRRWDAEAIAPEGWTVDAERRSDAWRGLFMQPGSKTVLIVTSNGAARFALTAHPELARATGASLKLRTGAWGRIDVETPGRPTLVEWDVRPA